MKLIRERSLKRACDSEILSISYCPQQKIIACCAYHEPVKLLSYPYGKIISKLYHRKKIPIYGADNPQIVISTFTGQLTSYDNSHDKSLYGSGKEYSGYHSNFKERDETKSEEQNNTRYLNGPNITPVKLKFLRNGNYLLTCYKNGDLIIYDIKTKEPIKKLHLKGKVISTQMIRKDVTLLLSTDAWEMVVLNLKRWEITNHIKIKMKNLGLFCLSHDFKKLYLVIDGRHIKVLDFKTQEEISYIRAHNSGINMIRLSPDGKIIASCGNDGKISLFDSETGKKIAYLVKHYEEVHSFRFSASGKYLFSSAEDNTLKIWDLETYEVFDEIENVPNSFVMEKPSKSLLMLGNIEGNMEIFRILQNTQ